MHDHPLVVTWRWMTRHAWLSCLLFTMLSGLTSAVALRQNNLTMLKLRSDVFAADAAGVGVEASVNKLRSFVYAHMNTNLKGGNLAINQAPIQLKYTYDRLRAAEEKRVSDERSKVQLDATSQCESRFGQGQFPARLACIKDYVASHTVATKEIPKELYMFDFVSPTWSFDLAGWAIIATVLGLVATVVSSGVAAYRRYTGDHW